eukprot:1157692-Pelagomonas_calceolata.AAC.3
MSPCVPPGFGHHLSSCFAGEQSARVGWGPGRAKQLTTSCTSHSVLDDSMPPLFLCFKMATEEAEEGRRSSQRTVVSQGAR